MAQRVTSFHTQQAASAGSLKLWCGSQSINLTVYPVVRNRIKSFIDLVERVVAAVLDGVAGAAVAGEAERDLPVQKPFMPETLRNFSCLRPQKFFIVETT